MSQPKIETIADDNNHCGEGPIWDPTNQRLLWNDLASSLVYQLTPETGQKSIISRGLMAAGIALNRDGALVFAGSEGLHLWRGQDDYDTLVSEIEGEKLFFNDMIAAPGGRVYVGTCYWGDNGMTKHGKLYRFDPDGSVRAVADGIELSNGLGFSPDDRTLYHADSTKFTVYAYDVKPDGALANRRTFTTVTQDDGLPDGLTVDGEGFVWTAHWYGGQVLRFDPDGKLRQRVKMPARQVSSVAFGGPDLTDLYVTSAADSWPSPLAPRNYDYSNPIHGGPLYRIRGDVQGKAEHLAALRPARK